MKLWIHGYSGRMGLEIKQAIVRNATHFTYSGGSALDFDQECKFVGKTLNAGALAEGLKSADVVTHFSVVAGNALLFDAYEKASTHPALLIGATGFPQEVLERWRESASKKKFPLLIAPNTSLGVLVLSKLAYEATKILAPAGFDPEIIETHHRRKKDAPSGTAMFLAKAMQNATPQYRLNFNRNEEREEREIGIHAVRGGGVFGEHEVRLIGEHEELTLSHRAFSRKLFAEGALILSRWLRMQSAGAYTLDDIALGDLLAAMKP